MIAEKKVKQMGKIGNLIFLEGDILEIITEKEGRKERTIGRFVGFSEKKRIHWSRPTTYDRLLKILSQEYSESGLSLIYITEITEIKILNETDGKK